MSFKMLEQIRAKYAFDCILEFKALNTQLSKKISEKDYASQLRKLPSRIMQNGLLTTLAFLKSKSKAELKSKEKILNDEAVVLYQLVRYLKETTNMKLEEINVNIEDANVDIVKGYLVNEYDEKGNIIRESEYAKLIGKLLDSSFSEYRAITSEALRIAQWLKRIAEGEIEDEGKGSD